MCGGISADPDEGPVLTSASAAFCLSITASIWRSMRASLSKSISELAATCICSAIISWNCFVFSSTLARFACWVASTEAEEPFGSASGSAAAGVLAGTGEGPVATGDGCCRLRFSLRMLERACRRFLSLCPCYRLMSLSHPSWLESRLESIWLHKRFHYNIYMYILMWTNWNGSILGCWIQVADHLATFWLPDI